MACFRFVLAMLGSLQKETETHSRWKNLSEAASPGAAAPNQARTPLGSRLAEVRPSGGHILRIQILKIHHIVV